MRYRCEQIGVKTVPVHFAGLIPEEEQLPDGEWVGVNAGEWVMKQAEKFFDGPEPIDPTHIREGVVVRIINRPTFAAYKHKNVDFKILEGIIKNDAVEPDMEEADGLEGENYDENC
jgi:hypothetical protein